MALNEKLPKIFSIHHNRPNTLTIDGGTASGKSTLSLAIKALYSHSWPRVQIVSIDWFMRPRRTRAPLYTKLERSEIAVEDYHVNTWDLDRFDLIIAQLLAVLKSASYQTIVLDKLADRDSGESTRTLRLGLCRNTFLILEGTGVLHPDRQLLPGPRVWTEAPSLRDIIERKFCRNQLRDHTTTRLQVADRYLTTESMHDSWISSLCKSRADWLYISNSSEILTKRE